MRRLGFLLLGLTLVGCAVSEEDIQRDFDAHVAQNDACETADDCALVSPGCPLGCFVAVRADAVESTRQTADDLISQYETFNGRCDYDCLAPGPVRCEAGRCTADAM